MDHGLPLSLVAGSSTPTPLGVIVKKPGALAGSSVTPSGSFILVGGEMVASNWSIKNQEAFIVIKGLSDILARV